MQNIRHSNKGILGIRTTIKEELWLLLFHQAITTNNNNRNSKQVDGFKDGNHSTLNEPLAQRLWPSN